MVAQTPRGLPIGLRMAHPLCPMPYALCPMPCALCPMPYALCPLPYAYATTVWSLLGPTSTILTGTPVSSEILSR